MKTNAKSKNSRANYALTGEWSTPDSLYNKLDSEFHFTVDACAQPFNAKCAKFYSKKENGLVQDWGGEVVYCCPPSGTGSFRRWVEKAASEAKKENTTVVMLLPASTDSKWFHEHIYQKKGVAIRFLDKRVAFTNPVVPSWVDGNAYQESNSVRPSMVVVFTGTNKKFACE